MTEQERIHKPSNEHAAEAEVSTPDATGAGADLVAALDDLLDEIDGVLEANAEDFVKNYVQKGGE